MASYLLSIGFVEAKSDTSLFVYQRGSDTAYLLLYVDDIVLTASSTNLLWRIISALQREFAMKDLGELHHFLGSGGRTGGWGGCSPPRGPKPLGAERQSRPKNW